MLPVRGCHPLWPDFPDGSSHTHGSADPRSLATTRGVSVDFLSSGYLDVSVPRVRSLKPMYSASKYLFHLTIDHPRRTPLAGYTLQGNNSKMSGGLPHSEICGSKPILGSPQLIAEYHVLHRLLLPRHPPNALLALDLIQKKRGFFCKTRPTTFKQGRVPTALGRAAVDQKVIHFPWVRNVGRGPGSADLSDSGG